MTIKDLEHQNNVLEKKLKKYKNTYFGPLYILSISIVYLICQIFKVDNFFRIFPNIQNSLTFTLMGSFVLGLMLGVCKIEYNNSVKKIKQKIMINKGKINDTQKKISNSKKAKNKIIDNKKIKTEIEQIKKQETKKSIEKILNDTQIKPLEIKENINMQETVFEDIDFIQTVDEIDISKIKEKVLQKRLEK